MRRTTVAWLAAVAILVAACTSAGTGSGKPRRDAVRLTGHRFPDVGDGER